MESRDGKCDPFDGVYSRVSFNLIALRNECIAFSYALVFYRTSRVYEHIRFNGLVCEAEPLKT
jgi:hypothetical protein